MNYTRMIIALVLSIGVTLNCGAKLQPKTQAMAQAQDSTDKLLQLQGQIKSLESNLLQDEKSKSILNQDLAQLEVQMGNTFETLRQYQLQIKDISEERKQLTTQVAQLTAEQNSQVELLSNLLQHIYAHAKRERWSMLLNQNDIHILPRLNHYYQSASTARKQEIQRLITQLQLLQDTKDKLSKTERNLLALKTKTFENQHLLMRAQQIRADILAQLKQKMTTQKQSLSLLKEEKNVLENVLAKLNKALPPAPEYIEPILKFSSQKNKLSLPIEPSETMLSAVMANNSKTLKKAYIKAAQGTPVHAIYRGKVVFSEWLRGIGLLLIIDHSNGYMSLYGNNEILYKSVGDSVNEGDIIARVGQSGGQAEPGLYFELRKDGIALETSEWFKLS